LVQDFETPSLLWFNIIGQSHARFSNMRQSPFGSAFLDRVHFMVQYYWTEPFRFSIVTQKTFCGSALWGITLHDLALSDKTFHGSASSVRTFQGLVLLYRTIKWFCTCCRTQNGSAKLHSFFRVARFDRFTVSELFFIEKYHIGYCSTTSMINFFLPMTLNI
jgi:hypothetical protein